MYSEIVLDHFKNPRNIGEIEAPDGIGSVGNPVCGDLMEVYITVKEGKIEDIKNKLHCSNLGADALHAAIADYYERKEGRVPRAPRGERRPMGKEVVCHCPYCDIDLPQEAPFCSGCGREIPSEGEGASVRKDVP
jgi:nitrogen fixation NifU-like protein